jgi:hypothetical protein
MKMKLTAALAVLACASIYSLPAAAQDHDRNWENGNVIATTQVHTEPGMFNAYINDLRGLWRVFLDQQIKDGNVPNWAAFDLSNEYFDDLTKRLQGSLDESRQASLDRGKLRRLGGTAVYQEIKFKD